MRKSVYTLQNKNKNKHLSKTNKFFDPLLILNNNIIITCKLNNFFYVFLKIDPIQNIGIRSEKQYKNRPDRKDVLIELVRKNLCCKLLICSTRTKYLFYI